MGLRRAPEASQEPLGACYRPSQGPPASESHQHSCYRMGVFGNTNSGALLWVSGGFGRLLRSPGEPAPGFGARFSFICYGGFFANGTRLSFTGYGGLRSVHCGWVSIVISFGSSAPNSDSFYENGVSRGSDPFTCLLYTSDAADE